MTIQAILMKREYFTKRQAEHFLKRNNFTPIKEIHSTKKYYRSRQITPNYKKYKYCIKRLNNAVDAIIQYNK